MHLPYTNNHFQYFMFQWERSHAVFGTIKGWLNDDNFIFVVNNYFQRDKSFGAEIIIFILHILIKIINF